MTAEYDHDLRLDGIRSSGVWGGVMGAIATGTILFFLLYGYYYLDLANEPFVPEYLDPPPVLVPSLLVGVLVLSVAPALWVFRSTVGRAHGRIALGLGTIAVVGTAFLAVGGLVVADQGLSPSRDAYSASVVLVLGFHGLVTLTGVVIAGYVAYQAVRMLDHPWLLSASAVAVVWWIYIVIGWLAVGFSVFGYPQLAPGAV
jgi:heme/copper-type cytochrome/quinol oxidase subunit 3